MTVKITEDNPIVQVTKDQPTVQYQPENQVLITKSNPIVQLSDPEILVIRGSGTQGAKGDKGGQYLFTQAVAASVWSIAHNLGYNPNVATFDNSGNECKGEITHTDLNNLTVSFNTSFTGVAYLS